METLARTAPPNTAAGILAAARDAVPQLIAARERIEAQRGLPSDIVELLRSIGVFRMGVSRQRGGPELTSVEQTQVIEVLAQGDAAAGWCAMIGMDTGLYARFLSQNAIDELMPDLDMITAGLMLPAGTGERVEGGYRLSGRWRFGSGITHADLVIAGGFVSTRGERESAPSGAPTTRVFVLRPDQVRIHDTWETTGLNGTGSHDYEIVDVFVPEAHTFSFGTPLTGTGPLSLPDAFVRNMPGVPLGVARAALDHVRELVETRTFPASGIAWKDDYRMQHTIGECEMELSAARHAAYGTLNDQWSRISQGGTLDDLSPDERTSTVLARVNSFRAARSIVSRLGDLVGTMSIYRTSPLERWKRDLDTMRQHIVVQDQIIQSAGAHLVGGRPLFPFALGFTE